MAVRHAIPVFVASSLPTLTQCAPSIITCRDVGRPHVDLRVVRSISEHTAGQTDDRVRVHRSGGTTVRTAITDDNRALHARDVARRRSSWSPRTPRTRSRRIAYECSHLPNLRAIAAHAGLRSPDPLGESGLSQGRSERDVLLSEVVIEGDLTLRVRGVETIHHAAVTLETDWLGGLVVHVVTKSGP
jgi:hypothetical protein